MFHFLVSFGGLAAIALIFESQNHPNLLLLFCLANCLIFSSICSLFSNVLSSLLKSIVWW